LLISSISIIERFYCILGNIENNTNECKRSLKEVLLHNGNCLASMPVADSRFKGTYANLMFVFEKLKYLEYKWLICGD